MKNLPLILGASLAGAYLISSSSKPTKKIDDGKCGCFTPLFILNKDCTIIEKINPLYNGVKDFEKINKYLDTVPPTWDVYYITNILLTKKYGNCLKQNFSNSLYQYLFITQLFDVARVLYLFDRVTCNQYKNIIFVDFINFFTNETVKEKDIIHPYTDGQGIVFNSDNILDEQLISQFGEELKQIKSIDWLSKDSSCLAVSILINQYLLNELDVMIYDWSLTNQETLKRFERFTNIVNQAKLKVKQNG